MTRVGKITHYLMNHLLVSVHICMLVVREKSFLVFIAYFSTSLKVFEKTVRLLYQYWETGKNLENIVTLTTGRI